jgi:hypothetical protein
MHVTRHRSILDTDVIERLWDLYVAGFITNRDEAVSRELLHRHEFDREMRSQTTRVWVVWEEDRPVAMAAVDTDIAQNDWVNVNFLARRFPEQHRRGAIHYCMFLLVHPEYWGTRAMAMLAKTGFAVEAAEGAIVVFDVAEVNQPTDGMGVATVMARLAGSVAHVDMVQLEVHRYYGMILNGGVAVASDEARTDVVAVA